MQCCTYLSERECVEPVNNIHLRRLLAKVIEVTEREWRLQEIRMKRHKVTTTPLPKNGVDFRWKAEILHGNDRPKMGQIGCGPTEEEACRDLGVKSRIRLWNELP